MMRRKVIIPEIDDQRFLTTIRDYETERQILLFNREQSEVQELALQIIENLETMKTFIKSERNIVKQLIFLIGPHFNIYPILFNYPKTGLHSDLSVQYLKDSMYVRDAQFEPDGNLYHNYRLNKSLMISFDVFNEQLQEFNFKKRQDEVQKRVIKIPELFSDAAAGEKYFMNQNTRKFMKGFDYVADFKLRLEGINVNRSILDDLEKMELKDGPFPLIKNGVRTLGRTMEDSIRILQTDISQIKRHLKE